MLVGVWINLCAYVWACLCVCHVFVRVCVYASVCMCVFGHERHSSVCMFLHASNCVCVCALCMCVYVCVFVGHGSVCICVCMHRCVGGGVFVRSEERRVGKECRL